MVRPGGHGHEGRLLALHPAHLQHDFSPGTPSDAGAFAQPERSLSPSDPLEADPTLASLLPALEAWRAVPGAVVMSSDAGLSHHLQRRFGLRTVPDGRTVRGPCLRIPSLSERGSEAVRAAIGSFSRGRRILPDLVELWSDRIWMGGWAELASALADLDARCPDGPLHLLAVRGRRADLVAPSPPALVVEVTRGVSLARWELSSRGLSFEATGHPTEVAPGDAVLELAAWPAELSGRVRLVWGRHGLRVCAASLPEGWAVRAASDTRGEATPVEPDVPVVLGTRGRFTLWQGDAVVLDVRVTPQQASPAATPAPPVEPPLRRVDRRVLLETVLEATASTVPLADALPVLVARHPSPGAAALAGRLGSSPVATLSRWLADGRNEALRLVLADGLAATDDPPARRARLPRAVRCWIPRWSRLEPPRHSLRLVAPGPAVPDSDWWSGLDAEESPKAVSASGGSDGVRRPTGPRG